MEFIVVCCKSTVDHVQSALFAGRMNRSSTFLAERLRFGFGTTEEVQPWFIFLSTWRVCTVFESQSITCTCSNVDEHIGKPVRRAGIQRFEILFVCTVFASQYELAAILPSPCTLQWLQQCILAYKRRDWIGPDKGARDRRNRSGWATPDSEERFLTREQCKEGARETVKEYKETISKVSLHVY